MLLGLAGLGFPGNDLYLRIPGISGLTKYANSDLTERGGRASWDDPRKAQ
jgi:hypothetical protein